MAVAAIREYSFEPLDLEEKFHGNRLLYVGWEDHLLFCAPFAFPLPPAMSFRDLVEKVLPPAYGYHPDFARIDWAAVQWFKSGQPWHPRWDESLDENGLRHKDLLRFRTPGLTGIAGSCS
jgi:phenol hydroxylase P4 protein